MKKNRSAVTVPVMVDAPTPEGAKPLAEIKVMQADPAEQAKQVDEIKKKYAEYFGL